MKNYRKSTLTRNAISSAFIETDFQRISDNDKIKTSNSLYTSVSPKIKRIILLAQPPSQFPLTYLKSYKFSFNFRSSFLKGVVIYYYLLKLMLAMD